MKAALDNLEEAVRFYDICMRDVTSRETGAYRDALDWLESAAREVVKARRELPQDIAE